MGGILRQNIDVPFEMIVVLDGPEAERSVNSLKASYGDDRRIKFNTSHARRGSPAAKNVGAAEASGDVLVFLDDDTIPTDGWLRAILDGYTDGVVGVGGSEEKTTRSGSIRRIWHKLWGDVTGSVTRGGLVISNFTPLKSANEKVDCLAGANMSFLRGDFEHAGGFDTNYRGTSYREETDLCLRIGGKSNLVFVPRAKVIHHEEERGGNTPESVREWNYWYHRNNTYFFLKNLGGSKAIWIWHQLLEVALSVGRTLQQRSMTPLTTFREGTRIGKSAYAEYKRSLGT